MHVLVTGATGFVGSHVVRALKARGHIVTILVRNTDKASNWFDKLGISVDRMINGSVTDMAAVKSAMTQCDGVVHAAALTPMPGVNQEELFATNVMGVQNVIDNALAQGIRRIVHVSSITAIFPQRGSRVNPDAEPALSHHPYGQSKAAAEMYIRGLQAQGMPVKVVYPGGITGPDDPGFSATLYALKFRLTEGFRITSSGTQQIDVRDLADIIVSLLETDPEAGRYLTPGIFQSWADFADLLESITGQPLVRKQIPGWFLRLIGRFYDFKRKFKPVNVPISAETMRYTTQWPAIENDPVIARLGITLRPPRETFTDTIRWMCDQGRLDTRFRPK